MQEYENYRVETRPLSKTEKAGLIVATATSLGVSGVEFAEGDAVRGLTLVGVGALFGALALKGEHSELRPRNNPGSFLDQVLAPSMDNRGGI